MIQYLKMKVVDILFAVVLLLPGGFIRAQEIRDSLPQGRSYTIDEVVVTGTRNETDIRHLPMTVSVVGRQQIEQSNESSLLPLLTEQVPGLFITSRGMMGYGIIL
jgi:outer membrane cobalamin receptor